MSFMVTKVPPCLMNMAQSSVLRGVNTANIKRKVCDKVSDIVISVVQTNAESYFTSTKERSKSS
ncbi:MAG TPA: hypothetical protein VIJ14_06070 [Rhabdochlamydiaceae bacterium]